MNKLIVLSLVIALLVSALPFHSHSMGAAVHSDNLTSAAEYECQMLLAETTDWDAANIVEACQP